MKIGDIHPGYLSLSLLLAEHRDICVLGATLSHDAKEEVIAPEILRWLGYGWALKLRHKQLECELTLRGHATESLLKTKGNSGVWPTAYADSPSVQFDGLKGKLKNEDSGRIPLPKNQQVLWSQHKYSVLARDPNKYKDIGKRVATQSVGFDVLALELVELLRIQPSKGGFAMLYNICGVMFQRCLSIMVTLNNGLCRDCYCVYRTMLDNQTSGILLTLQR